MGNNRQNIDNALTQTKVAEWISKGHTRQYCLKRLVDDGMTPYNAQNMYYGAMKLITPEPDLFDEYKKGIIQQNLDRLEQIVESSISGNTGEKMVALKAIDTLNKLVGAYGENSVTIAKNKDNEEIIRITFDK